MNVIDSYLDTLFAPYPDSPRLREAKIELRAMMEDKQQGLIDDGLTESQSVGQVIAEFGTLEEVAPVLGISTELGSPNSTAEPHAPRLELDRARAYVQAVRDSQWLPAAGLALFVLCAVPLVLLIALTSDAQGGPATWALGTGIVSVLVLVCVGIVLLMLRDARLSDFKDIDDGDFTLTAAVRSYAEELRREHRRATTIAVAVAITLWILCAVPTILTGLAAGANSFVPLYGVSLTLAMVALGLAVMARAGWVDSATDNLLQEECADEALQSSSHPAIRVIAAIYWPLITAIFLAWSFISGDWGITWVIWPVAGVLHAGLSGLNAALRREEDVPGARPSIHRA